jgi:hypothetical protein
MEYQGDIYEEKLQNVCKLRCEKRYDLIFGSWALSYLNKEPVSEVL